MAAINYYREALKLLDQLHVSHPTFSLGRHLSTALSDYGDVWGMTNKEMLFALQKYQEEIAMTAPSHSHEQFVEKIVKDAMDIDNILGEDEEDNDI